MIGIPIGLLVFNAGEWAAHRYILHWSGMRKKDAFWRYHFHEHHHNARKHDMHDPAYHRSVFGNHAQGREALGLTLVGLAHLPLFPVAPFYVGTVWWSLRHYHKVHKRAHMDTEWAKRHVPWHYDHHMGPNQHANWGVTHDWFDRLVGTRKRYLGTDKEREDSERRAERAKRGERRTA
jgi:sterol desaturase/sphingolipid hydroxylase (fatty acid hydroxylase superfamily)